ncbi:MAG: hypothetical protein HWN65_12905 [Candidatus Helarchaeota archaeon]|nr:hypothetical protein [Candidatus Helarchaeota archaeon]
MSVYIKPFIKGDKVEQVSFIFEEPISIRELVSMLKKANGKPRHAHRFTPQNYVYSYGEIIAVILRCSCGRSKREFV